MDTQRQFMADASHELRTPVATTRTAANVALQQPHRDEREYRETLAIIEQQATRLSRIVDDMFTLARADAGTYPVRRTPMYLDEVVEEVVKAARVLASTQEVSIEAATTPLRGVHRRRGPHSASDGEPARQRGSYTPAGSAVRVDLERAAGGYALSVSNRGPGIPRRFSHTFSSAFTGRTRRALAVTAEPDWGSLLRAGSRTFTTGTSRWCAHPMRAPPSRRFFQIAPSRPQQRLSPVHARVGTSEPG